MIGINSGVPVFTGAAGTMRCVILLFTVNRIALPYVGNMTNP
jgi:hypothetical protein